MENSDFMDKAFRSNSPKFLYGFSRPLYHNLMGLLYGRKFNKKQFGGMLRSTEAAMLSIWAGQVPENGVIVEIGCYGGLSTSYLAKGSAKNKARIFGIDPFNADLAKQENLWDRTVPLENKPDMDLVMQRMKDIDAADRVTLLQGFSQEVVKTWQEKIDFLWIDGNHEQAYQDFVDWSPFLNSGGRVALHDAHPRYGYQSVADDARKIFNASGWSDLEHVKSIITGIRTP